MKESTSPEISTETNVSKVYMYLLLSRYFYFSLLFFYILFVMLEIKIKIKAFNPFIVTSRYVKLGLVFLFYFSLFLCFDAGSPISFDVFLSNFIYSIKRCKEKVTQDD